MDLKDILLMTIEGLNASVISLSATNKNRPSRMKNYRDISRR